ncbi:sn-glycerol-3-phosphate ABC transporter ATP-binding protein UgpC [Natronolimnobius sp. AArcel1]|uniref:ABC transporter ATP-binding protein n=1 Tax=Natronolimnobius sp. AArcel1 TaxID=1679093 RepID=UPI0013EB9351|nr:sn-glycerol-3-phosphate ABC transporter ATP-binding protein UgpC [Natronolimnobius sp. AArcel1]NGM70654.1 sn-glycerol-3-phosphate ABC transporter ATP-binding protein UgpC [Natronolimnobius sp. AArcel1]
MAELTLDNVTKNFDDGGDVITAVDNVSVEIEDGEFLVLVGPSGCGKSTTLRMIAGLETISDGQIAIGNTVVNDAPAQQRDIAMVFQSYALYPHMTVRENMRFGLEESTSMSKDEMNARVDEAAETLEISELLDRKPGELSGGQQQRVALGRAIVRDPSVFLMDEPLSNLDAKLRSGMRMELQRLQEDLDVTTVYVTHDQTEAMTMGDRIAILNNGTLQQVATPLECYHRPRNLFVAGFIGEPSMNFFDVTLEGDRLVGDNFDFEYPLSQSIQDDLDGTKELVLGIRPEDIELVETETGDHVFPAVVDVVEPMGNENNLLVRFPNSPADDDDASDGTSITFNAIVDGMRHIEEDTDYRVEFPESAIHLFDRASGTAIHNRTIEQETELLGTRI